MGEQVVGAAFRGNFVPEVFRAPAWWVDPRMMAMDHENVSAEKKNQKRLLYGDVESCARHCSTKASSMRVTKKRVVARVLVT